MSTSADPRATISGLPEAPPTLSGAASGTLSGTLSGDDERGTPDAPLDADGGARGPAAMADLRIEREIGRGGMGVVYLAVQESLERPVAVKTLRDELTRGVTASRFRAEALTTGRLEHPNIPPVHGFGRDALGRPYLAMKLVKGVEWARLLAPTSDAERARAAAMDTTAHVGVLSRVSDAIAFAHAEGVLHRDLKPENVMVGEFGEVLVMDWGIALDVRARDAASTSTSTSTSMSMKAAPRSAVGTPAYMPPEMARADEGAQGPWTDVYLLGGLLYELLSGAPPHRGGSVLEVLLAASKGVVEPAARRAPAGRRVPDGLAEIAARALDPDPARRFSSARAFADALAEFGKHEVSRGLSDAALEELRATEARIAQGGAGAAAIEVYPELAAAVAQLAQARKLWEGNTAASEGLVTARLAYARFAAARGDLELAEAQLVALTRAASEDERSRRWDEIAEAGAQVVALRESRARERARRRRLLWALAAAVLLGAAAALAGLLESRRADQVSEASARRQRAVALAEGIVWREPTERISIFERAVAIDDTWAEGYTELARAHTSFVDDIDLEDPPLARVHYAAALAAFDRALAIAPGDPDKINDRAYLLDVMDRPAEARRGYGRTASLVTDTIAGLDAAAWLALDDGRFDDLERVTTRRLEKEKLALIHFQRALGRIARGDAEGALADAREADRLEANDEWFLTVMATALLAAGRDREAAEKLVIAARVCAKLPHAGPLLAYHAARSGDLERARALTAKAREERAAVAGVNLAIVPSFSAPAKGREPFAALGRVQLLTEDLAALVPAVTPRALTLRRRGEARFEKGEHEGALADAERALGDDPADGAARLLRARCFLALGHPEAARSDLGIADRLAPDRVADVKKAREELAKMDGK